MPNKIGMLGDLFGALADRAKLSEEEQVHQYQAQDPFRAMAHTAYRGGTLAGQGLARTGIAAAGGDPRTRTELAQASRDAAAAEIKTAVAGLQPGTDEYFAKVIAVLNKHGLVDQATALQEKWEASKLTKARTGAAERENQPKPPAPLKGKDALLAKYDDLTARLADDPDNPQLQAALTNVDAALKKFYPSAKPEARWKVVPPTQDSPGYKYDEVSGEVAQLDGRIARPEKTLTPEQQRKADEASEKMKTGYESAYIKAQADYDAAVELYNNPNLEGALGAFNSAISDTPPADRGFATRLLAKTKSSGETRAIALLGTVKAGAFLTGFQEIKAAAQAAGAQGAGFGALSDAEGARIQAAKAALDSIQDAKAFRVGLKTYIDQMVASWNAVSGGAAKLKIPAKRIVEKPLTAGAKGPRVKSAPSVPAPAPAAPASGDWTPEKEQRYQELLKKQNGA